MMAFAPEGHEGPLARLDAAAFGLIYGTVTSLSVLMAMGSHPDRPFQMAAALFGSVLAVTLAKAFAEVMHMQLSIGQGGSRASLAEAWRHSRPTLVAANVPTLLICLAGIGVMSPETAIRAAQTFGVLLLAGLGARVGWVSRRTPRAAALAAVFTGGIGIVLAALKYLIH